MPPIALIITDTQRTRLGQAARLDDTLAGTNVLTHTLRRASRLQAARRLVIVHPAGQADAVHALLAGQSFDKPVHLFEAPASTNPADDAYDARTVAARHWAPTAWRGGLGGATVFDETLPAAPLAAAMHAHDAESAVLLRAEWCLFDPRFAEGQLTKHLEEPAAFKLTFSQAPPGLSCLVAHRDLIDQLAESHGTFGRGLGYQPKRPQADPIGRELNHPIPHTVRDTYRRFVYDTPRSIELIRAIAGRLGHALHDADAVAITDTARAIEADDADWPWRRLPQQVTLELTPRRDATGPITPQHHATFERSDIDLDLARRIVEQLGDAQTAGDVALRLGGLGDALLHPQWDTIAAAAHEAGVASVGIDTDLLCDRDTLDRLLAAPVDLVTVRLNADTAETYRKLMGVDRFEQVADNLQYLFDRRRELLQQGRAAVKWIVPRLIKTADSLADMEPFFERWMTVEGHAVIEPPQTGCGLMPDQNLMPMAPPRRRPCRQLGERMTILSDGRVAMCDQDWQGHSPLGEAQSATLLDLWQRVAERAKLHATDRADELDLCARCSEWHRP